MEINLNTTYNVGDRLYALNSKGEILNYYISKIIYEGKITDINSFLIRYDIVNSKGSKIATITSDEITDRFFIDKKDIVKHIVEQL